MRVHVRQPGTPSARQKAGASASAPEGHTAFVITNRRAAPRGPARPRAPVSSACAGRAWRVRPASGGGRADASSARIIPFGAADTRKFVRTARRYRTIEIQAGADAVTAAGPCPPTCAMSSTTSMDVQVCTNVSQVGNTSTMNRRATKRNRDAEKPGYVSSASQFKRSSTDAGSFLVL